MREKELRIALVCFGGVSLAVYMHGVSKEILKLVRASRALHDIADRGERAAASFFDKADRADPEFDSEEIYFELLRDIGRTIELRVIVDIVAGASAGGINGAMLARALAHDLPMNDLRRLWLDNADVDVLLAPEARASTFSKWLLRPLIWGASKMGLVSLVADAEARDKISLFLRSRWFKPPLDGLGMAGLMLDAALAMGAPRHPSASLLPVGHALDLFVTVTDFHGYQQAIQMHDPPIVHELEHRHVLRFSYRRRSIGAADTDFDLANAPAIAFAARATSSFPGAFPPASIAEMDGLLTRRRIDWPRRADFIERNFAGHLRANIDPAIAPFIDGAVLNNRPFREAISAIHGRPAYREVDRRLVYIDPDPAPAVIPVRRGAPGFFATLRGALSDIPRSEPVTDELGWVFDFNERVRRLRSITEEARPHVSRLVTEIVREPFDEPVSADQVRLWRERINDRAVAEAGFAYEGYVRLKLASVRAFLSRLIIALRRAPPRSPLARAIAEVTEAWAARQGLLLGADAPRVDMAQGAALPAWVSFLLSFDVEYRKRRLNFLIEGQNRLYGLLGEERFKTLDPRLIDRLKREFYRSLEALRRREQPDFYSRATQELAAEVFPAAPSPAEMRDLRAYAEKFVAGRADKIGALIENLAEEIDLDASTRDVDAVLAAMTNEAWHADARAEVFIGHLGFPFWDVLTFPIATAREAGEFHEILVDRISPQDAHTLGGLAPDFTLRGVGLGHFAAFLSRAYRENDYLLGRLQAIDRLIDIVCDSAGAPAAAGIDILALKKRAFLRILDAEQPHLAASKPRIAELRKRFGELA